MRNTIAILQKSTKVAFGHWDHKNDLVGHKAGAWAASRQCGPFPSHMDLHYSPNYLTRFMNFILARVLGTWRICIICVCLTQ